MCNMHVSTMIFQFAVKLKTRASVCSTPVTVVIPSLPGEGL